MEQWFQAACNASGMIMDRPATCFTFPCSYPLKVMGLQTKAFEQAVRGILEKHLGKGRVEYASQLSSNGKYLSLTATFTATSREQLDALYRELNGHKLVVMTL
jgi:putative lipoic acid-binding regulatory protein